MKILKDLSGFVIFHDRNVGREYRWVVNGIVLLEKDPEAEMLSEDLAQVTSALIQNKETEGTTDDACYPEWMFVSQDVPKSVTNYFFQSIAA